MLRFDPFRDLDRLTEQLLATNPTGGPRSPRFMPMDVYRTGDQYVLLADLPGVDPATLDIHLDNGVLTVKAERHTRVEDGAQWIASERFAGSYLRQLSVGDGVDVENISASYDNGVLTLRLPVADRVKPRRIEVSATGGPVAVPADTRSHNAQPVGA